MCSSDLGREREGERERQRERGERGRNVVCRQRCNERKRGRNRGRTISEGGMPSGGRMRPWLEEEEEEAGRNVPRL